MQLAALGTTALASLLCVPLVATAKPPPPKKKASTPVRTVPVRTLKRHNRVLPVRRVRPALPKRPCRPGEVLDAKRAKCFWLETKSKATGEKAVAACKARGMELSTGLTYPKKDLLKSRASALKGQQFLVYDRKASKTFQLLEGLGHKSFPKKVKGAGAKPANFLCHRVAAGSCRTDELKDKTGSCFYASSKTANGTEAKKACAARGMRLAGTTEAHLALSLNFAVAGPLKKKFGPGPVLHMGLYDKASKSILFGFTKKDGYKYRQVELPQTTRAKFLCHAKYTWRKP